MAKKNNKTANSINVVRRSKIDLDSRLLDAAEHIIKEVGFDKATVLGITTKADIQASVFYTRYTDLNDFFDKLVREYDYWLNDSIRMDENLTPLQNYENGMFRLIDSLWNNKIMQQLLIWELNGDNIITKRTSENREHNSRFLIDFFLKNFKGLEVDFNILTAILIGGIYYLLLHRNVSSFCLVDFNKKENIIHLKETIQYLIRKTFDNKNHETDSQITIAKKLYKEGVNVDIIQKSFNFSDEIIAKIANDESLDDHKEIIAVKRKRGRPRKNA